MTLRLVLGSAVTAAVALTIVQSGLAAQAPALTQQQGAPQTAQNAALADFTGYWVSVVNQDWRFRMMTPPKGDYAQVPLNAAARKIADEFNPALYGGANYQTSGIIDCRAYGAAGLMHMPTRLHVTWDSPNVLKIETDWGEQTRLLRFTPGRPFGDLEQTLRRGELGTSRGPASIQGSSMALWEQPYRTNAQAFQRGALPGRAGGLGQGGINVPQPGGNLAVVTTNLAPGWLRRNGVPYSARTRLVEHYQTFQDPTGKEWINVSTEVNDPEYLNTSFLTTADFRKEPDGSKWAPHPCKKGAGR
jgi:hypothetical protein